MNKVVIQGEVAEVICSNSFQYKIVEDNGTFWKINSTKDLRIGDIVIAIGSLFNQVIYIDNEETLVRDSRELVLDCNIIEIKSFGTHFGGIDSAEDLDYVFEKINW